jgi:hypothetical protein
VGFATRDVAPRKFDQAAGQFVKEKRKYDAAIVTHGHLQNFCSIILLE